MCKENSLETIISRTGGPVKSALACIPIEAQAEARRLLVVLEESGAEPWTALAALYRHSAGRLGRAEIHLGLKNYFEQVGND